MTEMTSQSQVGQARITLQFGLDRDINGAARDVQAAINAARADLPTNLLSNPIYRKVNPADAPILIVSLTSNTLTRGQIYDAASTVLQQQLSQLSGVGQVIISGAALPAVRVELQPQALFKYGIGLEDVRAALASANANSPKGIVDLGSQRLQIYTNDQASHAADYRPLIVAYRNGARGAPDRRGRRRGQRAGPAQSRPGQRQARRAGDRVQAARRQRHRDGGRDQGRGAEAARPPCRTTSTSQFASRQHGQHPRLARRYRDARC